MKHGFLRLLLPFPGRTPPSLMYHKSLVPVKCLVPIMLGLVPLAYITCHNNDIIIPSLVNASSHLIFVLLFCFFPAPPPHGVHKHFCIVFRTANILTSAIVSGETYFIRRLLGYFLRLRKLAATSFKLPPQ